MYPTSKMQRNPCCFLSEYIDVRRKCLDYQNNDFNMLTINV